MPNCGYCRDCEYWQEDRGICVMTGSTKGEPNAIASLAYAAEYAPINQNSAYLVTKPDFGCVQFEARDAA